MKIKIRYFAGLREKAGKGQEDIVIEEGKDLRSIYLDLSSHYGFTLSANEIKYSVNNEYVEPSVKLQDNDVIVFIPPVAGG